MRIQHICLLSHWNEFIWKCLRVLFAHAHSLSLAAWTVRINWSVIVWMKMTTKFKYFHFELHRVTTQKEGNTEQTNNIDEKKKKLTTKFNYYFIFSSTKLDQMCGAGWASAASQSLLIWMKSFGINWTGSIPYFNNFTFYLFLLKKFHFYIEY